MTFETVPEPFNMHNPVLRFRQKVVIVSRISIPPGISSTYGVIEGSASRVMMTGGLGLFFDPAGLPRGRRTTSMVAPSLPEEGV